MARTGTYRAGVVECKIAMQGSGHQDNGWAMHPSPSPAARRGGALRSTLSSSLMPDKTRSLLMVYRAHTINMTKKHQMPLGMAIGCDGYG
ncbi:hypothetical protein [Oryza sativa Japonica Group]|uniref:Uncharacterized protein n=1 Tax=Oryza sativa subsp. japonica TaxID=39947 RepID=Q5N7W7_ORYSJ|nr:hypothetical protein [Oryza sativa Japonica Group]